MKKINSNARIALACPSFSGGGAERVMVTLANKLSEYGYEVDLIVGKQTGPYREMVSGNVNNITLMTDESSRIRNIINGVIRLRSYCKSTSPLVIMSTVREFNVFVSISLMFLPKKPRLILREAAVFDQSHISGSFKAKILYFLMRLTYSRADKIISNSKATTNDLVYFLRLNNNKIIDIYNPLIVPDKLGKRERCNSCKIIVCVGRLVKNKNFGDIVKVLPLIMNKHNNVILKILGEGEEEKYLKCLAASLGVDENVQLLGFVKNPYIYYQEADVFVQTSLWEGFGYVLAEAMACGTPVVAYDSKGAMREILDDGRYGLLTPVGDMEALADAIIEQIEKPTSPLLLEEAVQRFDVDVIARQYLEVLGADYDP